MASESQSPEQEYVSARKMIPPAVVEVLKWRMSNLAKSITLKEPPKWLEENAHPINVVINRRVEREKHT